MKKQEFLQLIEQYGIDLNKLSIGIDGPSGFEGAHGVYEKNGQWIYYSADGRNHINEIVLENEDEAFETLFGNINVDLRSFTNKFVTREIAKIPKKVVCSFMQEKYSLTEKEIEETWDYLKQDMNVLFEFKYYVANGEFVPEKHCYKVQGYSAEQLTNYFGVLGAYKYLIYLIIKPQEALENLKNELQK